MIKKNSGFVAIDMAISIMAIIIFSSLIIGLITSNALENLKLKKETLAIIYMTEFFENIGIADYNDITQEKISDLIPEDSEDDYTITTIITDVQNENILKKVTASISYKVGNKEYSLSMERMKAKE